VSNSDFSFGTECGFPLGRKKGLLTDLGLLTYPSFVFFILLRTSKKYILNSCGNIFKYYNEPFFIPYALNGNHLSISSG